MINIQNILAPHVVVPAKTDLVASRKKTNKHTHLYGNNRTRLNHFYCLSVNIQFQGNEKEMKGANFLFKNKNNF